ncbi:hypothetical protein BIY24_13325 [Halobacteriovorax marinus]|uniref:hypothetical protein n=1 Tax=Halobacteriovorax marinus TaxID=97084 RepID=UPI000BC2C856|nr:hypothetical protein [Halobacteriovorax marinus]ATH08891.1 hypothetical protein BIY24_13325 [Halobacteriovorax marinus]
MRKLFLICCLLLSGSNILASSDQEVCLFEGECWVELNQGQNKELLEAVASINSNGLELIKSNEAQGNLWFRVYKRVAKYSTRGLRPRSINEYEVRSLLKNGMRFFKGSDYEAMLSRYDMGSDFYTDLISFYRGIKYYSNEELSEPLSFEAYYYNYDQSSEGVKVPVLKKGLSLVENFITSQAMTSSWESLVTIDFTNALYNENYEYRPYLLVTNDYVVAALYRWQL